MRALPPIAASAAPPAPIAVPSHQVDLDAGFLHGPQNAGVIGTMRTSAAQDQRGAAFG